MHTPGHFSSSFFLLLAFSLAHLHNPPLLLLCYTFCQYTRQRISKPDYGLREAIMLPWYKDLADLYLASPYGMQGLTSSRPGFQRRRSRMFLYAFAGQALMPLTDTISSLLNRRCVERELIPVHAV
jgi:hypothetical protein